MVTRLMSKPQVAHFKKQILRYIKRTMEHEIFSLILYIGYIDVNWAKDLV
jgi:hypothetical protein